MVEKKYEVLDSNGKMLAEYMTFEMAMVFMRGYRETFHNEVFELTIREMDMCIVNSDD